MKEEDYSGNTEKGIEAGKITAKGLSSFILEEFKSFTKTTKKINKHKIKKHHRRKSPAFTNMSKSEDVFQNPFQICKCYMPRDNNINRIEEADLFTLITAIYNFVHFKNRLSDFEPLYIEARRHTKFIQDLAKGKILLTGRQLLYYVDLLITLLVKVEAVNKDTSVSEDRKVSIKTSISDARKDLEKMKISIEHPPYKRYTFPIEDKRDTTAVEKKEERSFRSRKTLALALLIAKEDLQDFVTHVFEVFHRTLNKDNIIDEVRKKYKNGSPNLTNVCVEDLLNDPFNILKIFTGKYETLQQMTSASDMDLETMISAMLTFRDFDEKFSVDLKELKSQILSTDRVPDVQSVIWKLSKLLSDSKYQRNDKKAINAVKRLREVMFFKRISKQSLNRAIK
ncbi:uncharacterized protein LOC128551365 [Mercenaria mercenaria]|uniref:uncharacterized protein LOC128551365 n=1 Tax=Mercenaria mercenaria TaxID=6596 RepID=UPI00234EC9EE|nr:uncharacterized protein LOC128551365 [Mercenaria mercenaria]